MLREVLERQEYQDIKLYTMENNNNNEMPIHIRRFGYTKGNTIVHRHEAIQLNYVKYGTLNHEINGSQFQIVKGDIFIIPPYIPHRLVYEEDTDFEIIELEFIPTFIFGQEGNGKKDIEEISSIFDFAYIEPFLVSEKEVKPRLNLSGKIQIQVEEYLEVLLYEYKTRCDGHLLAIKANLLGLLVTVGRSFRQDVEESNSVEIYSRQREYIAKAIDYIDEHYSDPITIAEVSKVAMLSQSYFSYLFKAVTDKTFIEYVHSLRIKKAMDLLRETSDLVINISAEAGFNNVNHFNRTFKSHVGVSPMQYRKCEQESRLHQFQQEKEEKQGLA